MNLNRTWMKNSLGALLVFAFFAPSHLWARPKEGRLIPVRIRTYAYAHVSQGTLDEAKLVAARVLGRAGVQTDWVDCHLPMDEPQGVPICGQESQSGISDVNINLTERLPREAKLSGEGTLGFAVLPEKGGLGDLAYVSVPNIQRFCAGQNEPMGMVMGLVFAHEVGHLLLRKNEHSPTGIMRASWDKEDLKRAKSGELQFTPEERTLLKAFASARS